MLERRLISYDNRKSKHHRFHVRVHLVRHPLRKHKREREREREKEIMRLLSRFPREHSLSLSLSVSLPFYRRDRPAAGQGRVVGVGGTVGEGGITEWALEGNGRQSRGTRRTARMWVFLSRRVARGVQARLFAVLLGSNESISPPDRKWRRRWWRRRGDDGAYRTDRSCVRFRGLFRPAT